MRHWDTIWQFKTARFNVTCDVTPEEMSPDEHFDCDEDVEAIQSGAVDWFVARIRVALDGRELAAEYLGACAYRCASDFVREERDGYFRDMVREAVKGARLALAAMPKLRVEA